MNIQKMMFVLLVAAGLSTLSTYTWAKSVSIEKVPNVVKMQGYCCDKGRLFPSSENSCTAKKGDYYATKSEARKNCKKSGGGTSISIKKKPVRHGYCCDSGEIKKTTETLCLRSKGAFFTTSKEATYQCGRTRGYCCDGGAVSSSSKAECERGDSAFFLKKNDAERECAKRKGYCCDDGEISSSTKGECDRAQGIFELDRTTAQRRCNNLRGYCCSDGNVFSTTNGQCINKGGTFSTSRMDVETRCRKEKGYCCINGNTIQLSQAECTRKKGAFYTTKSEATRNCILESKTITPLKETKLGNTAKLHTRASRIRPNQLPDLDVVKTWVDKGCIMHVDAKNNGGAIAANDFKKAHIHISAGPGNSLSAEKRYLRIMDPKGNLKKPGGAVSYNTGLTISGSLATRVWLDADHKISESNEQNNGDNQTLSCKESLLKPVKPDFTRDGLGNSSPLTPGFQAADITEIVVSRIFVTKDGKLFISLKKGEGSAIDEETFNKGLVQVRLGRNLKRLPLKSIDKKQLLMKKSSTPLVFDSGLEIVEPVELFITFTGVKGTPYKHTVQLNGEQPVQLQSDKVKLAGNDLLPSSRVLVSGEFRFIHPTSGETFSNSRPTFSWRPHPQAEQYFIRIMKTDSGGADEHRTIWSKGGIAATSVRYNNDGRAVEPLEPGMTYRANLYARLNSHSGSPNNDPADYVAMTGDVTFTLDSGGIIQDPMARLIPGKSGLKGGDGPTGQPSLELVSSERMTDSGHILMAKRILESQNLELGSPDLAVDFTSSTANLKPLDKVDLYIKGYDYSRSMYIAAVHLNLGDRKIASLTKPSELGGLGQYSTTIPFTLPLMLSGSDQYYFTVVLGGLPGGKGVWGNSSLVRIEGSPQVSGRNDAIPAAMDRRHGHGLRILTPEYHDRYNAGSRIRVRLEIDQTGMGSAPPSYYEVKLVQWTRNSSLPVITPLASRVTDTDFYVTLPSTLPRLNTDERAARIGVNSEDYSYQIEARGVGERVDASYGAYSHIFFIDWPAARAHSEEQTGSTLRDLSGAGTDPDPNPIYGLFSSSGGATVRVWPDNLTEVNEFFDLIEQEMQPGQDNSDEIRERADTLIEISQHGSSVHRSFSLNVLFATDPVLTPYIVIDEILFHTHAQRRRSITDRSLLPSADPSGYTRFSLDIEDFPVLDNCTLTIYYHILDSIRETLPEGVEWTGGAIHQAVSSSPFNILN